MLPRFEGKITPKLHELIELILQLCTGANDYVLDSFAGSGTTAHAVFDMNKEVEGIGGS